jgi:hypothetical protein
MYQKTYAVKDMFCGNAWPENVDSARTFTEALYGFLPLNLSDMRPLIDFVSDPLVIVDALGLRLLQVNERAAALLGLSGQHLLDSALDGIMDEDSIAALRQVPTNDTNPAVR